MSHEEKYSERWVAGEIEEAEAEEQEEQKQAHLCVMRHMCAMEECFKTTSKDTVWIRCLKTRGRRRRSGQEEEEEKKEAGRGDGEEEVGIN